MLSFNKIGIDEAASMFMRRIKTNDKPYDKSTIEHNNSLVEEWKEKMLRRVGDSNSEIRSEIVHDLLMLFLDGKNTRALQEHRDRLSLPTDEDILYWRRFFEMNRTIEKLLVHERDAVIFGWKTIVDHIRDDTNKKKLEKIFYDDNPAEWYERSKSQRLLLSGSRIPPLLERTENGVGGWTEDRLKELQEIVTTIMSLRPAIQK